MSSANPTSKPVDVYLKFVPSKPPKPWKFEFRDNAHNGTKLAIWEPDSLPAGGTGVYVFHRHPDSAPFTFTGISVTNQPTGVGTFASLEADTATLHVKNGHTLGYLGFKVGILDENQRPFQSDDPQIPLEGQG